MTSALTLLTLAVCCCALLTSATKEFNVTEEPAYLAVVSRHGEVLYMREELARRLVAEEEAWHWTPWLRTRTERSENLLREAQCAEEFSVESFPEGPFDHDQLRRGAFLLYVLFGVYAFTLLALICNDYFIPCVELICEDFKIPHNVAAATFMAVATSFPEFFVNVISIFIMESDMGIGTIVGSAIFNGLGVGAIGGLAAIRSIKIEMVPLTRDVIVYMVNVAVLVTIVWDGQVEWYEALILAIMYVLYFVLMFNSMRLFKLVEKLIGNCCKSKNSETNDRASVHNIEAETDKSVEEGLDNKGFSDSSEANNGAPVKLGDTDKGSGKLMMEPDDCHWNSLMESAKIIEFEVLSSFNANTKERRFVTQQLSVCYEDVDKPQKSLFRFPSEKSWLKLIWWLYTWPIKVVLGCTITSPVTCRRFYPFTFFMCITWIGITSYCVTWSMTVLGNTFLIPDSVMGMTFLAFGGCLPEACSIFIMSRKGVGGIGLSNALGGNSLAILFALGLPWLIRTLTLLGLGEEAVVHINSNGIGFVISSLMIAVICLWITLYLGRFTLRKRVGGVLAMLYVVFITFSILVEMNVILERTIAFC